MTLYQRKLYTLLVRSGLLTNTSPYSDRIPCLSNCASNLSELEEIRCRAEEISKASDRVNFENLSRTTFNTADPVSVRHLISGQHRTVENLPQLSDSIIDRLNAVAGNDARKAFWWLWRFYPQYLAQQQPDALLYPADRLIPDCPLHSYNSTVSAIAGAIPQDYAEEDADKHPYLLLFTFSPVQEFIKSSRKFLDFWAGSYLLHYLSARLCWYIARVYGPDAVITPSLWSQEIIDALIAKQYPNFQTDFAHFQDGSNPASRFQDRTSTSLSTAGFPNVITAIVPGKVAAEKLGAKLGQHLNKQWRKIALKVRSDIRHSVIDYLNDESKQDKIEELIVELARSEGILDSPDNPNRHELEQWKKESSWEWRKLWEAQIDRTWEPYWTAVPLGHPERTFSITGQENVPFGDRDRIWIQDQETIAPSRNDQLTPTEAEDFAYTELNIGTWWANSQSRLGQAIQAVKNTRNWRISAAPGERSTISGQFSAVHPQLRYGTHQPRGESAVRDLREGAGMSSGSMQLFWQLMALVYPGLFNGSEKLNALELTKRMAWQYGGVAESLGINPFQVPDPGSDAEDTDNFDPIQLDYETLIRFPNLCSIAAARFSQEHPERLKEYWDYLWSRIKEETRNGNLTRKHQKAFYSKSRRFFQVPNADKAIKGKFDNLRGYNGVMFSSKWLIDDMGLNEKLQDSSREPQDSFRLTLLRNLVTEAHKECGFGDSSPADWWAIIVADGDGMGKYVNGSKLKPYQEYLNLEVLNSQPANFNELLETRKRMGPATHVGLNRALLDFSNRLVPYLTEQRFCGKVVYSGGDDVLAVLPLADLPEYLLSLRAAWCGGKDPYTEEDPNIRFLANGGYWQPEAKAGKLCGLLNRPLFTMGEGATMSAGIVIAHKSVPLATVLESLWSAEEDRAKEMQGATISHNEKIEPKDGLCFRVIYGGGNVLEATMKGHLLSKWWEFVSSEDPNNLAPVLYRLAEELPTHAALTESDRLLTKAAKVIINSRDESLPQPVQDALRDWLNNWEDWAYRVDMNWQQLRKQKPEQPQPVGCSIQDLAKLLRFSAFWLDKMAQQNSWGQVR
ncbi:MAG: type III-B CRISPR-associated protein Cas10/Cmr2 [Oscillatoriales cyanobacterium]|uniref:type III-B CRISPR-associated protein Cas10/Cmr2 n=1 Tax=unclassified Microcoleus TaxID=2642155 RepID=UPI001E07F7CD|nr:MULTISPECIES: type III-B CRISPR-associated protein Cas10/Cmr2 [unclassified Microcoleus]TAE09451.1 MAG: type III-B CRISPR-associated protein Cas10/Cmr2 [Oscillatoriales cyanobacterium]MCC3568075.1 type III-B CRISPR-associated protein Cas10/Cmr2 [Microcoleus sp. PH2017_31_RDM_U_A]MCC3580354.1 type III-B CRISPR-associated protein Cas10/Cmr2 [Microcoleus sp. PH2017_32_RDM_D_A]MCC3618510.1 type III-B CRISPR-associated protein Cas10/Cmr2 [Microcoleus sp. PH2017_38_RDM_U_B]TAE19069.1 MAG: type II